MHVLLRPHAHSLLRARPAGNSIYSAYLFILFLAVGLATRPGRPAGRPEKPSSSSRNQQYYLFYCCTSTSLLLLYIRITWLRAWDSNQYMITSDTAAMHVTRRSDLALLCAASHLPRRPRTHGQQRSSCVCVGGEWGGTGTGHFTFLPACVVETNRWTTYVYCWRAPAESETGTAAAAARTWHCWFGGWLAADAVTPAF